MRRLFAILLSFLIAPMAQAGELISGTNTYVTEQRTWPTGLHAGYYMYDSKGTIEMHGGPLPNGPVECHGAGFWTETEITGEGICIFGARPNQWTVAFKMADGNAFTNAIKDTYQRRGAWRVVEGVGEYWGMTGSGTFITGPTVGTHKTTQWEGEVVMPSRKQ